MPAGQFPPPSEPAEAARAPPGTQSQHTSSYKTNQGGVLSWSSGWGTHRAAGRTRCRGCCVVRERKYGTAVSGWPAAAGVPNWRFGPRTCSASRERRSGPCRGPRAARWPAAACPPPGGRRREFCQCADALSPSLLRHLLKGEGGCSRMAELPPPPTPASMAFLEASVKLAEQTLR